MATGKKGTNGSSRKPPLPIIRLLEWSGSRKGLGRSMILDAVFVEMVVVGVLVGGVGSLFCFFG